MKIDPAAPPYSSGISIPMRPSSKNLVMSSGRNFAASSMSWTWGRISVSANSRTVLSSEILAGQLHHYGGRHSNKIFADQVLLKERFGAKTVARQILADSPGDMPR